MIQESKNMTRLPNEWHDCGQGNLLPFISWKVHWPSSYPEANCTNLKKFCHSFFNENWEEQDNFLNGAARSIAKYLLIGKSYSREQWFAQLTIPEIGDRFIYPFIDEYTAVEYGKAAYAVIHTLMTMADCTTELFHEEAMRLIETAGNRLSHIALWESASGLLLEAFKRGIPVNRLSTLIPLFRLGHGHRQKRIWRGFTNSTSHIGTIVSTHKQITNQLLNDLGFPVAKQYLVQNFEDARKAAAQIGYPVVVKPSNTDFGTGVSTRIMNEATLYRSFTAAKSHGNVIVEKHIEGTDFRLTVTNGKCVSVVKRIPAHIVGNGIDPIKSLVKQMAAKRAEDPFLRNFKPASLDDPLVLNTLEQNNVRPESIPEKGQVVFLRTNANVSTGGTLQDVTPETHPENIRLAERAASCVGLDYAGIDLITPDVSKSWRETGGGICEVNPTPMSIPGTEIQKVDYLFPDSSKGRIPLVVIVGHKAQTTAHTNALLSLTASRNIITGSVTSDGAIIGHTIIVDHSRSTSDLLRMVLADKETEVAFVQITPSDLKYNGLNVGYCSLAIFCTGDNEAQDIIASPLSILKKADAVLFRPTAETLTKHLKIIMEM